MCKEERIWSVLVRKKLNMRRSSCGPRDLMWDMLLAGTWQGRDHLWLCEFSHPFPFQVQMLGRPAGLSQFFSFSWILLLVGFGSVPFPFPGFMPSLFSCLILSTIFNYYYWLNYIYYCCHRMPFSCCFHAYIIGMPSPLFHVQISSYKDLKKRKCKNFPIQLLSDSFLHKFIYKIKNYYKW